MPPVTATKPNPSTPSAEPSQIDKFMNWSKEQAKKIGDVFNAAGSQVNATVQSVTNAVNVPFLSALSPQNLQLLTKANPEIDTKIAGMSAGDKAAYEKFKGETLAGMLPESMGGGEKASEATQKALSGALTMPGANALAYTLWQDTKDMKGVNAISTMGVPVIKQVFSNILPTISGAWQKASQTEGNFIEKAKVFLSSVMDGVKTAASDGVKEAVVVRADNAYKHVRELGYDENFAKLIRDNVMGKAKEEIAKIPVANALLNINFDQEIAKTPQTTTVAQTPPAVTPANAATPAEKTKIASANISGGQSATAPQTPQTPNVKPATTKVVG